LEKIAYVTHSDKNYLSRALSLVSSLRRNGANEPVYLFCNDKWTFETLERFPKLGLNIIKTDQLSIEYPDLANAYRNRSKLEFYYCISPFIVRYLLDRGFECVVYLDSDLCFYENPTPIINKLTHFDLGIVPHRFKPEHKDLEKYGKFNVGMLFFRDTAASISTLTWWQAACLDSTSSILKENSYADQKYLDTFPELGARVYIFEDSGHNAAPWNCNSILENSNGSLNAEGSSLVYFHFSGLKIYKRYALLGFTTYRIRPNVSIKKMYSTYIHNVIVWEQKLGNPNRIDYRRLRFLDLLFYLKYLDFILIRRKIIKDLDNS
jgi:hypothetical protein